jgi:hypothetical protein
LIPPIAADNLGARPPPALAENNGPQAHNRSIDSKIALKEPAIMIKAIQPIALGAIDHQPRKQTKKHTIQAPKPGNQK